MPYHYIVIYSDSPKAESNSEDDNRDKTYKVKKTPVVSEADSAGSLDGDGIGTVCKAKKKKTTKKKAKVSINSILVGCKHVDSI